MSASRASADNAVDQVLATLAAASRLGLLEFGQACNMTRAQINARVIELATIVLTTLNDLTPLVAKVGGMKEIIEIEARRFLETFER